MTISLDSKVLEWARKQAEREKTSVSKLIARLLEREKAEGYHERA
jgi:predicted CopG family antitoxin